MKKRGPQRRYTGDELAVCQREKDARMAAVLAELTYDRLTGCFHWAVDRRLGRARKGGLAGTKTTLGYIHIRWRGEVFKAHRLAFYLVHGWCPVVIDHADGDPANNAICNLRSSDPVSNGSNRREHREGQLLGVTQVPSGRWQAQLWHAGCHYYGGTFDTPALAHQAYLALREKLRAAS